MMLGDLKFNLVNFYVMWEKIMIVIFVEVEVDFKVMVVIDCVLVGFIVGDYFVVGIYYYEVGKDLNKVLEMV